MPFGSVTLIPGVNSERTPTLLRAGVTQSALIRYKDGLIQKLGGWSRFTAFAISGIPRALHPWQDLNGVNWLAIGTTTELDIIDDFNRTITPQIFISSGGQTFSTTLASSIISVTDPNISNVTTDDVVLFEVPVSIAGLVLDGYYPIAVITGATSYQIDVGTPANATTSTVSMPLFTTVSGSSSVDVTLTAHGLVLGDIAVFQLPTIGNGVTIFGHYKVIQVKSVHIFSIAVTTQATASSTFAMSGPVLVYTIASGPSALGVGFGLGGFGVAGFGTGTVPPAQPGLPYTDAVVVTNWTLDNWGEILLACPNDGPIFYWDPTGGFETARLISAAPLFNRGIFVSMAQQILIAYGSSVAVGLGQDQQPLLVQWSTDGDFQNWAATAATQAGNFTIPTGSKIVSGMAVSNQNLIWTDLDLWAMNYIGPPDVYGFNKIGAGAGLVSQAAAQQFRGSVFWMGRSNFYSYTSGGVAVMPCTVWDVVFQNLNTAFLDNIRAMPNTTNNEVGWLYPSTASLDGENDSYVKINVTEPGMPWDYGPMARSAWVDESILGPPVGTTTDGIVYQHETSPDADGAPMVSGFVSGYFYIAEGEDFAFVDQIYPDFKWTSFGGTTSAEIYITFFVVDNLGDTPRAYGPYLVTQATDILGVRFRGRQMAIEVGSGDVGSFWRIGHLRWRYAPMGRR